MTPDRRAEPYPEPTPDARKPSGAVGECLSHPSTEGFRLPEPLSERDAHHSRSGSRAGRERFKGTTVPRQAASDARDGATPEAGPPGLVLEGTLSEATADGVGWSLREDECPLEGALAFDRTTGEVVWRPTCKNARCPRCSRQVSAQTFALARRAVEQANRVRFITLTRAPDGWQETRQAMRVWRENLARHGVAGEGLWVVERGSETGMKHVHVVQWGPRKIPLSVLDASWPYGMTQIEAARAAVGYLEKGVMRYVAKGIDGDGETIEAHMNLNGGRAAHWSRRFFAGMSRTAYRQANPLPGIYFVQTARQRRGDA